MASIPWALEVEFPEPFKSLLDLYSFTQLNFLKLFSLSCLGETFSGYHPQALLTSLAPIALAALIWLAFAGRKAVASGGAALKAGGVSPAPKDGEVGSATSQRTAAAGGAR